MNSYYNSLKQEILKRMEEEKYREALDLIEREINLPYVPADSLAFLRQAKKDCLFYTEPDVPSGKPIEQLVYGNPAQQQQAVSRIGQYNLRQLEEEVQHLLDSSLSSMTKGALIEELIAQKIDAPYTIEKDGLQITFVPGALVSVNEDAGIKAADALFEAWFGADDPGFLNFCRTLLMQEALSRKPFDLEEENSLEIAVTIADAVFDAMMAPDEKENFMITNDLKNIKRIQLYIEKENENGN